MLKCGTFFLMSGVTCLIIITSNSSVVLACPTLNTCILASTPEPKTTPVVLQLGSKGNQVKVLQTRLTKLGFYKGLINGNFDNLTKQGVIAFQKSKKLAPTGIVNQTTWNQLNPKPATSPSKTNFFLSRPLWFWIMVGLPSGLGVIGFCYWIITKMFVKKKEIILDGGEGFILYPNELDQFNDDNNKNNNNNDNKNKNNNATSTNEFIALGETSRLPRINIIEELIKELDETDPERRHKAIWDLAQQGDSSAIQPLINLLLESDSSQQILVTQALSQIATRTLKPINRVLAMSIQHENPDVRKNAVRDLTQIYDLIIHTSHILSHLVDDPDQEVKETVRYAISQLQRIRIPPSS